MQVASSKGTREPYNISRIVSLLISPEDASSNLTKETTKQFTKFASVNFKWALVQRRQWCFWIIFTYGLFFFYFLFAWQSYDLHLWMLRWNVLTDNAFWSEFLSPCIGFHAKFSPVLYTMCSEGPKMLGFHYWSLGSVKYHRVFCRMQNFRPSSSWESASLKCFS